MNQILDWMQSLGFSQYEAKVYLALLQQPDVTGYELAKNSGVPASKIYAILNKLIAREVVQAIDSEPKKYIPQPPDDILSRMRGDYLETIDLLSEKLDQLYNHSDTSDDHIWNLTGRNSILRRILDFINEARDHLYLSVWDEEVDEIASCLQKAHRRGVQISIVHFGQRLLGIGNEFKHGREHQIRIQRGGRRIVLIVDDKKVILGHFSEDGSNTAAWTTNKGLVLLAKDYIIHDIYSILTVQKFGEDAMEIFTEI